MTDSNRYILTLALLLGIAGETSGCSFRSPSVPEQQELVKRGAFPGGPPAWLAPSVKAGTGAPNAPYGDGLVPGSYGAPPTAGQLSVAEIDPQSATSVVLPDRAAARAREEALARREAQAEAPEAPPSASAIDRIATQCPGIEPQVSDALTTVETDERIRKYETLIARCPRSSDLLLWLGRDHYKSKNLVDAGKYLERAVLADRNSSEAKQLLEQVRSEQNQ